MNENETQNMTPKQIVDLILFEQHISKHYTRLENQVVTRVTN